MTLIDEQVDLELLLQESDPPCIACCKGNVTFCGKPYHPETTSRADEDGVEDDFCPPCEENFANWVCDDNGRSPLHLHCPFREGNPVCVIESS